MNNINNMIIGKKIKFFSGQTLEGTIVDKVFVAVASGTNEYVQTTQYVVDTGEFVTTIHPYQITQFYVRPDEDGAT